MLDLTLLWRAPTVNPLNQKAYSIPLLNPVNLYGRVFFFAWFGFMIAFWSWYAFPPLLPDVIAKDIGAKQYQIANSNVIALTATLLVRLVAGPCCDHFGPRVTFAACLLLGSIPTFMAGLIHNAAGLMALRFFIGILGGSFVPCQVWTTGFFDKKIVGTANSLTGGLGNAGGGITYFVMPAVFNSLVHNQHMKPHKAWRVAFIVPGILIVSTALLLLLLCPDCPTGKWSDRGIAAQTSSGVVPVPGHLTADRSARNESATSLDDKKVDVEANDTQSGIAGDVAVARGEVVQKPTFKEASKVIFSLQTLVTAACYFCTFGAELAINSILGNYYGRNFPKLGLQGEGNWAAMFGLLNVVFRPLGGVVADLAYRRTGSVWSKKILLHAYGIITGCFLLAIGLTDSHNQNTMFGLVAGMAFFLEGANGLNFSLVPHVHPYANGIVSGVTGASGNLGGIVFAVIFRYSKSARLHMRC